MKSKKKKEAKDAKSKEIDFRLCGHKSIARSEKLAEMTIYFIKHENDFKEFVSMNVKAAELWKPKNSLNQSKKKQQKPEELNKDSRE